ncbi:MAG: hypothetical protein O3C40_32275 [Planctomycetota bacterium]|nr:hypothetical protein [Planctomycetota bacterium]
MKKQHPHEAQLSDSEFGADEGMATFIDAERELPGSVYQVPDKMWGFDAVGRIEHPGACTACDVHKRQAVLLKGTDAEGARRGVNGV